eukprot:UN14590
MKVKDVSKAIYDVVSKHQSQVADYNRWKGGAEVYDIPKFERSCVSELIKLYESGTGETTSEILQSIT